MAYFALLWKARTMEKYRQKYENEKIKSIILSNADLPDKTLSQRWKHYSHDIHDRLSRTFSKWYPEGTTVSNLVVSLRSDMRLASILLRSLSGFVGGLLLTYLGFMFFVFQLSLSLIHATILSSILGILLTLGLTFSNRMRCIIFLLIPQLFSRVGRYTLTCYALVLILTGPATNTLKNSEVLSESMACTQEQIKLNVRKINDFIRKPLNKMKDSLKITIAGMKLVVKKLKMALIRINRLILSLASEIQSGLSWLIFITDKCNEALGTPYEKCVNVLIASYDRINSKLNFDYTIESQRSNRRDTSKDWASRKHSKLSEKQLYDMNNEGNYKFINPKIKSIKRNGRYFQVDDFNLKSEKEVVSHDDKVYDRGSNPRNLKAEEYRHWFEADNVIQRVCTSLESFEKFCVPSDFAEQTFYATIRRKIKTFIQCLASLLQVNLNIHHTYTYLGNVSTNTHVSAGIVTEIRSMADPILTWLFWSSCVTSLFLMLIFFRAKHYQHMFETSSRFDNRFITKEFRKLDLKRLREGRQTVLPLNRRERAKYVTTTSFRLVASEKVYLNRSAVFMTITTFKLLIHMVADYSLYWVLMTIRHHGKLQSPLQPGVADTGAFISGSGFVARLLQSFIETLSAQLSIPPPNKTCLPNPHHPDFKRYCQIGFLIFLLWFLALFEPYGLRMRHLIMGHHRPQRAKARAVWLYNHILRTRASFMKFARRRLHREYKYSSQNTLTFRRWLLNHVPFSWLRYLLCIKPEYLHCLICNITEDNSDPNTELIRCDVPNCPGTYCTSCFADIGQLCTICLSPSDYGDISDVSLEKGSSDEDDDDDVERSNSNTNRLSGDRRSSSDNRDKSLDVENQCNKSRNVWKATFYNENKNSETFSLLDDSVTCSDQKTYNDKSYDLTLGNKQDDINHCIYMLCLKPFSIDNKNSKYTKDEVIKDFNNNNIQVPRILPTIAIFQYSMYEITSNPLEVKKSDSTTTIAKYLRKKKVIRFKKQSTDKNRKYFMTCSNSSLTFEEGLKIADYTRNAKETNWVKKRTKNRSHTRKDENNDCEVLEQNATKNEAKKINGSKARQRNNPTFSKFWRTVTSIPFPSKNTKTKADLSTLKENKHNRKKKCKRKKLRSKLNTGDTASKSRLFAYFEERDWAENVIKLSSNPMKPPEINTEKQPQILVNDVMIPYLNLNVTTTTNSDPHDDILSDHRVHITTRTINFAKNALDRFFKSMAKSSDSSKFEYDETKMSEDIAISNFEEHRSKCNVKCSPIRNQKSYSINKINSSKNVPEKQENEAKRISRTISIIKGLLRSSVVIRNVDYVDDPSEEDPSEIKMNDKHNEKICDMQYQRTQLLDEQIQTNIKKTCCNKAVDPLSILSKNGGYIGSQIAKANHDSNKYKSTQNVNREVKIKIERKSKNVVLPKQETDAQAITKTVTTEEKAATACPCMVSCGFQINIFDFGTCNCGVQVCKSPKVNKPKSNLCDAAVQFNMPACSCAAQYDSVNSEYDWPAYAGCKNCDGEQPSEDESKMTSETETYEYDSEIIIEESETVSDTTVCSRANIEYCRTKKQQDKNVSTVEVKIPHTKVITKSNKATLTDKTVQNDVSVSTDWWSPIVEKRDFTIKRKARNKAQFDSSKDNVRRFFMGPTKAVSFKNEDEVIPKRASSQYMDAAALSPMKYLLQSQKYYNELYAPKHNYSSRVFPLAINKWQPNREKDHYHAKRIRGELVYPSLIVISGNF